uniref:Uncharacterized protein n=1 Tax=Setaria digitata TaxID=48799 RepID=A0A915PSI2_9BILA
MADEEYFKGIEDNVEMQTKPFGDSELQQTVSGNDDPQVREALNLQTLARGSLQNSIAVDESFKKQGFREGNYVNGSFQLGFPLTDLRETDSMQIDSVLGSQNAIQENDFYSGQSLITSNHAPFYGVGVQQVPFEFENYANQILGQNLIKPFIAAKSPNDQIAYDFEPSQITLVHEQPEDGEITEIPGSVNYRQEPDIQKRSVCDEISMTGYEPKKQTDAILNKNLENWNSEYHQSEECELVPTVFSEEKDGQKNSTDELISKTEANLVTENEHCLEMRTTFAGIQFIDGKPFDIIGGLCSTVKDYEDEFHLSPVECQNLEETKILDTEFKSESTLEGFQERIHSEEHISGKTGRESGYSESEVMEELGEKSNVRTLLTTNEFQKTPIDGTQLEAGEVLPEYDKLEAKLFENIDSKSEEEAAVKLNEDISVKESMKSSVSKCSPERISIQRELEEIESKMETVPLRDEARSEQLELVQVIESTASIHKIENECTKESKLVSHEEFLTKELCEEVPEGVRKVESAEGRNILNKSLELPCDGASNDLMHENKTVPEGDRESESVLNISDQKDEISSRKNDENTVNKQSKDIEAKRLERDTKMKHSPEKRLKSVSEDDSDAMALKLIGKKTAKKPGPTAVKIPPRSKEITNSKHSMTDKKSAPKSAVSVASMKNTVLKEKNVDDVRVKETKDNTSTGTVKISPKRNTIATRPPVVTNRLAQRKPQEAISSTKSQPIRGSKTDMKSKSPLRSKDTGTGNHKLAKDLESDEKELLVRKQKQIGIIDLEPLVWMETLVPVYEQIWKIYEPTSPNTNKTDVVSEKTKNMKLIDELVENSEIHSPESIWEIKKTPESIEAEVIKSVILSESSEIKVQKPTKITEKQDEAAEVEEQITMEDDNGKREIEVSGSLPLKSFEAAEICLKVEPVICAEGKTFGTLTGQDIGSDESKKWENSEEMMENTLPASEHEPETGQSEFETGAAEKSGKLILAENVEKIEVSENEKTVSSPRKEESEVKLEVDSEGKRAEEIPKHAQPKSVSDSGHGGESRAKVQKKIFQLGGMHSDLLEEYEHNSTRKESSHKCQQVNGQDNSQQECNELSDKDGFQDSNQKQVVGNQNHSRKQQQHYGGYNQSQNHAGQQGHRKRNKKNKKPRNW